MIGYLESFGKLEQRTGRRAYAEEIALVRRAKNDGAHPRCQGCRDGQHRRRAALGGWLVCGIVARRWFDLITYRASVAQNAGVTDTASKVLHRFLTVYIKSARPQETFKFLVLFSVSWFVGW